MGRIWRQGQTRPVYIYRMVSAGTIEEDILRSQQEKNSLSSVVQGPPDCLDESLSPADDELPDHLPEDLSNTNPTSHFSLQRILEMVKTLPLESCRTSNVRIAAASGKVLLNGIISAIDDRSSSGLPLGIGYDLYRDASIISIEDMDAEKSENLLLQQVVHAFSSVAYDQFPI